MPGFGRRLHAEDEVGRGKMKEAERVRLQDLGQVHDAPQARRVGWNAHAQNRITGLCRCNEMADRTNSADACHERRHFIKWPVLAELFKAAELSYVKSRAGDFAIVIQLNGYLRVAFYASYRINYNSWHVVFPAKRRIAEAQCRKVCGRRSVPGRF